MKKGLKKGLKEWVKNKFRSLLKQKHPNMEYGNTLKFGYRFVDESGNPTDWNITEVNKSEL